MKSNLYIQLLFAFFLAFFAISCDDVDIEPDKTGYAIDLAVSGTGSSSTIEWEEATVSSFVEYILVRSTDSIPDTAEPELEGAQVVAALIDQREVTEFIDNAAPIAENIYYKLFVDIGERFLQSATVRTSPDVQILDFRADVVVHDPDAPVFYAYDRALDVLVKYDYEKEQIVEQKPFTFSNPILRFGTYNGKKELYINDRNQLIQIVDGEDLDFKQSFSTTFSITDFDYANGRFIVAESNNRITAIERSNFSRTSATTQLLQGNRMVRMGAVNGNSIEVFEADFSRIAKYTVGSATIQFEKLVTNGGTSLLVLEVHPDGQALTANSSGRIVNDELDLLTTLESGTQFINFYAYADDGSTLATFATVGNIRAVQSYDVNDDYKLLKQYEVNQTPSAIFNKGDRIYTVSFVVINGISRSALSSYSTR